MSSAPVPIIFFHSRTFPRYLYKTIESARFFNPESPIYLLSDIEHVDLGPLDVTQVPKSRLPSARLDELRRRYVHIASLKSDYIRICIERWFLIEELIAQEGLTRCAYADSDGMIFHDLRQSFDLLERGPMIHCSHLCGPALTFIEGSIAPFLDFILDCYADQAFLEKYRKRHAEARARGGMINLDDMSFLTEFGERGDGRLVSYPNNMPNGHIDHCIYAGSPGTDDIATVPVRRHGHRKRIFWEDRDGRFLPSFRRASDGARVPALFVHFQNGAKRRIRRFNRVGQSALLPRRLRLAWYNAALN